MAPLKRIFRGLVALVLAAALASPAAAQNLRLVEQDVKAGLLYNFLRYTQWPPSAPTQAAVVCLYGGDPFEGRLAPMERRTVNQRPIEVRTVRTYAEMNACSLLYLNAAQRSQWPQLRTYLANHNVLTVSDYDGFARSGGMIEFTRINNRIGVRINVGAVESARLSVEDRLLRLASTVQTSTP